MNGMNERLTRTTNKLWSYHIYAHNLLSFDQKFMSEICSATICEYYFTHIIILHVRFRSGKLKLHGIEEKI
jgi:hypothetical protein